MAKSTRTVRFGRIDQYQPDTVDLNQNSQLKRSKCHYQLDRAIGILNKIISTTTCTTLKATTSITSKNKTSLSMLVLSLGLLLAICLAPMPIRGQNNMGVTQSHSEAIKWSFGGWAPLNGKQNGTTTTGQTEMGTSSSSSTKHMNLQQRATSPLPVNFNLQNTAAFNVTGNRHEPQKQNVRHAHAANNRQQQKESLKELASDAHDSVHFAVPQNQNQQQYRMAPYQHESGQQQPPANSFSPPAPVPILREALLPRANHQHQPMFRVPPLPSHVPYSQQQAANAMHMQHSMMHDQRQHHRPMHQQNEQRTHPAYRPPSQEFMREMERRHRHNIMQHQQQHQHRQQMMMQQLQQHQHRANPPSANNMHQPPTPLVHSLNGAALHQMHAHHAPPNLGTFKVIEGEQPVIFSAPQGNEKSQLVSLERPQAIRNASQQQMVVPSSYSAAIEKDNSNYNTNNNLDEQQQQKPSNNIQDIKQRQMYDQKEHQQQQQQQQKQDAQGEQDGASKYLTIPVAVETEGDKVLTADDINEIEKHVINVLPNLKTADKIVKIADAQLNLANLGGAVEKQHQQQQARPSIQVHQQVSSVGPELHQINYEEHKSTMAQLEGDLKANTMGARNTRGPQSTTSGHQLASNSSPAPSSPMPTHYTASSSQAASTPGARHTDAAAAAAAAASASASASAGGDSAQPGNGHDAEHHYFIAAGPPQELATVDPDQVADYNLIKNDLLQKFHYEPTRATAAAGKHNGAHNQMGTTPPMPYTANTRPSQATMGVPTVTRYFNQGATSSVSSSSSGPSNYYHHQNKQRLNQQPDRSNLFGRLSRPTPPGVNGGNYYQQQQQQQHHQQQQQMHSSTTRAMLGGRKVSEVMRPLIRTTPVPITSPMHIPSVEPEKVDAIQFIAGHSANDKQPMVVEAHQLVSHTPDGGIDYATGGQQQEQHQQVSSNETYQAAGQQPQFYPQANPNDDNQGAIIEYVSISDQALNSALAADQQHPSTQSDPQQQQQAYEVSSTPDVQSVYMKDQQQNHGTNSAQPPILYAYSMSPQPNEQHSQQEHQNQQHQLGDSHSTTTQDYSQSSTSVTDQPPISMLHHHNSQQHSSEPAGQQPSLAWSPSMANEHQQQQMELSNQAGQMQQLDLPATAGYNLFGQDQQQTSATPSGSNQQQQQEYGSQQQQELEHFSKWRTKAGGRQPNPDAQYDGQIAKGAQGQSDEEEQQQANEDGQQQEQQQQQYGRSTSIGPYEQQQQNHQQHHQSSGDEEQLRAGYGSTSAYVGGAQLNHHQQAPSEVQGQQLQEEPQLQQQQHYGQSTSATSEQPTSPYSYAKLDNERQQSHLAHQQAQHQAQLAELMNQQQQQYQTTTPLTLVTSAAAIEQQQQQQQQEVAQQQQQQQQQQEEARQDQERSQLGEQQQQQQQQQESPPSVGDSSTALHINPDAPIQVPILDQQSLIQEADQYAQLTSDDSGKQRHLSAGGQPSAVYQVYQAYYAPKDHKPLPGYVRLSLDEFNELFKDAEIQFVDKNLNGLAGGQSQLRVNNSHQQHQVENVAGPAYEMQAPREDHMRASGSELQSIVVDRRSIGDRTSNLTSPLVEQQPITSGNKLASDDKRAHRRQHLSGSVKKIISIRSSRQAATKHSTATGNKPSKFIMKRVKSPVIVPTTSSIRLQPTTSESTTMQPMNNSTNTITTSSSIRLTPFSSSAKIRLTGQKMESMPKKAMKTTKATKTTKLTTTTTTTKTS